MNRFTCLRNVMLVMAMGSISWAGEESVWDTAEAQIKMVDPASFKSLPAEFRTQLQNEGCRIPQTYAKDTLHNVISGEFARKGQKDWAILEAWGR